MAKRITKGNLWGFIQSRPYASVADIRRLFSMDVDTAVPVPTNEGTCYIGLPYEAADLIRQLWYEGRIALDLNPDVKAQVVQGVYPARAPIGRPRAAAPPGGGEDGGYGDQAGKKRRRRRKRKTAGPGFEGGAGEGGPGGGPGGDSEDEDASDAEDGG